MPGKRRFGKFGLPLLPLIMLTLYPSFGWTAEPPTPPETLAPAKQGADCAATSAYHNAAWNAATTERRKKLYLFTTDFPADPLLQYSVPALQETRFWRLLDRDMMATESLSLTADPSKADYRVELQCSGVFNCSRLLVNVKTPDRRLLTSFSLEKINSHGGLGAPHLEKVSRELTQHLDERIRLLPQGGYGYF